jgi:hypothetical protein
MSSTQSDLWLSITPDTLNDYASVALLLRMITVIEIICQNAREILLSPYHRRSTKKTGCIRHLIETPKSFAAMINLFDTQANSVYTSKCTVKWKKITSPGAVTKSSL